jgi:preprotein translocase subunit SecG
MHCLKKQAFMQACVHIVLKELTIMGPLMIVIGIVQLIVCLILLLVIILQSGKNSGLSAFTGANESYLSKNKAKSRDARLALATKWVAGVFVILTVVLNLVY